MKTYTTVREDGNSGPELKANNVIEAEEKLKELSKNKQYSYRIVGEKVNLKL
jgi:hypothetical protein